MNKRRKHLLWFTIAQGVTFMVVAGVGLMLSAIVAASPNTSADAFNKPAPVGSPPWLIEKHGCWSGSAPSGAVAHHAVITLRDHIAPQYVGNHLTQVALTQVMGGRDAGMTVHAFCR